MNAPIIMNHSKAFQDVPLLVRIESDVALSMEGDQIAFSRIVNETSNMVSSIVIAIVRDLQVSEDLAQEVFFAAWLNLKKLRNPGSFLPWLRQTARNQAKTWIRKKVQERTVTTQAETFLAEAADPHMNPAERLLAEEESQALYQVLEALPNEEREIVTLYYREGRSTKQVAMLLDLREAAVRQRLSRARKKLRTKLFELFESAATKTTLGVIFTGSVMSGLTFAPSTASAATLAGVGKASSTSLLGVVSSGLTGLFSGFLGIFLFYRVAASKLVERNERHLLKKWVYLQLLGALAGAVGIATTAYTSQPVYALAGFGLMSLAVGLPLGIWLPRLIKAKLSEERNPDVAKGLRHLRGLLWSCLLFGLSVGWSTLFFAVSRL